MKRVNDTGASPTVAGPACGAVREVSTYADPNRYSQGYRYVAVNGQLAFPDGAAAAQAIPQIAGAYKHIELRWGDDLRLDPLTENLCVVADSYTEVIELQPGAAGPQGTQTGYFTGVAENRNGHWQFRDAHWSAAVVPEKIPPKK